MLGMRVGSDLAPAQPGGHHLGGFLRETVTLMVGRDDPGDLRCEPTRIVAHGGNYRSSPSGPIATKCQAAARRMDGRHRASARQKGS